MNDCRDHQCRRKMHHAMASRSRIRGPFACEQACRPPTPLRRAHRLSAIWWWPVWMTPSDLISHMNITRPGFCRRERREERRDTTFDGGQSSWLAVGVTYSNSIQFCRKSSTTIPKTAKCLLRTAQGANSQPSKASFCFDSIDDRCDNYFVFFFSLLLSSFSHFGFEGHTHTLDINSDLARGLRSPVCLFVCLSA